MKAEEITKGSTLLATLNKENFPFGMHQDLIDDLHRMINVALTIPVVVGRSEQLLDYTEWLKKEGLLNATVSNLIVKKYQSK